MFRLNRLSRLMLSSSKKLKRVETQIQEEKQANTFKNLESVVDQPEYTTDELQQFVNNRIKFVKDVAAQNDIPIKALLGTGLVILPLMSMTGYLFWAINSGIHLNYVPQLFTASLKYVGITTSFLSGIHWGTAMSLHEQQLDPINSSVKARIHFALATLPIFTSMLTLNYIGYQPDLYFQGLQTFAILNLYIMGLDIKAVRDQQLPRWWLKLRTFFLVFYLGCIGSLAYISQTYPQLLKSELTVFGRILQTKDQLLKK